MGTYSMDAEEFAVRRGVKKGGREGGREGGGKGRVFRTSSHHLAVPLLIKSPHPHTD